jgi:RNA polymerase sigma factor (TIGR02999 family)
MSDVTRILGQIADGDPSAAEQLLPLVYDELRKLAAARMAQEKPGQTLQATALVHDAYIRLVDVEKAQHWNSRGHFFGAAAEAMRRILVENARRKRTLREGGQLQRAVLPDLVDLREKRNWDLIDLDEVLVRFEAIEPEKSQLIKLRFFAGLSLAEAADAIGVSPATAKRHWTYARAWLYGQLQEEVPSDKS